MEGGFFDGKAASDDEETAPARPESRATASPDDTAEARPEDDPATSGSDASAPPEGSTTSLTHYERNPLPVVAAKMAATQMRPHVHGVATSLSKI